MRLPFDGLFAVTEPFGTPDPGRVTWLDGYHTGIDYGLPVGTAIKAMADGRITRRGLMGGKGLVLQLEHGLGLTSRYCHLESWPEIPLDVTEGEWIATSGASGFVTGPHLHWEVLRDGVYIDPLSLFADPETPLELVDGLWHIADVLRGLEHDPEEHELRRIVVALKPHLGL